MPEPFLPRHASIQGLRPHEAVLVWRLQHGEHGKDPEPTADDTEGRDDGFLMLDGSLMIFGGSVAYDSKRHQKLSCCEVYTAEPTMPTFLRWSESAITFDRTNHLESVPQPRRYPLVLDPIIDTKWLTKVLMDGGSGVNIIYAKTLDAMGIDRSGRLSMASCLEVGHAIWADRSAHHLWKSNQL